jgi:hypothetical protein
MTENGLLQLIFDFETGSNMKIKMKFVADQ